MTKINAAISFSTPIHTPKVLEKSLMPGTENLLKHFKAPSIVEPSVAGVRNGRCVVIVGGSDDYTGAPLFSAMAALRAGAENVFLLTTSKYIQSMRSYSPCISVLQVKEKDDANKYLSRIPNISSIVLGGGLDIGDAGVKLFKDTVEYSITNDIPICIDASALRILATIKKACFPVGHPVVLTPNHGEMTLLAQKFCNIEEITPIPTELDKNTLTRVSEAAREVSKLLNAIVVQKGPYDITAVCGSIFGVEQAGECTRRCAGQGDVLAGTIGAMLAQVPKKSQLNGKMDGRCANEERVLAACNACVLGCIAMRKAADRAFEKFRNCTAEDILKEISLGVEDALEEVKQ